jgi:uncharacterized protein (TIGR02996 family)
MTDESAFIAAVRDSPEDDGPRLVYADWLDEQGDPELAARAEFIRVQCGLAHLPAGHPEKPGLFVRERAILHRHRMRWAAALRKCGVVA